jgi:hypothetical protein
MMPKAARNFAADRSAAEEQERRQKPVGKLAG